MYYYKCEVCKKEFRVSPSRHARALADPQHFTPRACSMACNRKRLKGVRRSTETQFTTERVKGDKNTNWKGLAVGYSALHDWIRRELGTPMECENCGATEYSHYEWANLSGEYKRDVSDWARLCKMCHFLIDGISRGLRQAQKRPVREMLSNNKSGYKNVFQERSTGKFIPYIRLAKRKQKWLGRFDTAIEAYEVYKQAALEMYGTF